MLIRTLNKCIKQDYPVTIGDYASALQDEIFFRQLGCDLRAKGYKKYRVDADRRKGITDKNDGYLMTQEDVDNILVSIESLNPKARYKRWCEFRSYVTGICPSYVNEKGEIIRFCDIWNNIPKKYFPEVENIWWWQKDYAGALMEVLKPLITLRRESRQNVGRLI